MSVTIAIPFCNAEKYIEDAVKSVFAQTYQDWELLLIDDGSTDRSLEIVKNISDPRIRIFSDGQNKKLASRLNEITKLAKYEYIARMDADDLMDPIRIETQINILESRHDLDLVSTGMYSMLNNHTLIGYRGSNFEGASFHELLYGKKGIAHGSLLARKSWHIRNPYDEALPLSQDKDLWIRASLKNDLRIKVIPDPLYIYREEGNLSLSKMLKFYKLERSHYTKYFNKKKDRILYVIRSYIKTIIVQILNYTIGYRILLKRRNKTTFTNKQIDDFHEIIATIRNIKLK